MGGEDRGGGTTTLGRRGVEPPSPLLFPCWLADATTTTTTILFMMSEKPHSSSNSQLCVFSQPEG